MKNHIKTIIAMLFGLGLVGTLFITPWILCGLVILLILVMIYIEVYDIFSGKNSFNSRPKR